MWGAPVVGPGVPPWGECGRASHGALCPARTGSQSRPSGRRGDDGQRPLRDVDDPDPREGTGEMMEGSEKECVRGGRKSSQPLRRSKN